MTFLEICIFYSCKLAPGVTSHRAYISTLFRAIKVFLVILIDLTKYLLKKLSESVGRLEVLHTLSPVPLFLRSFAGVVRGRGDMELKEKAMAFYCVKVIQFTCFQIEKLHIRHDNSGRDPDWYLEEVTIDVPDKGEQYIFPCHRWLVGSQRDVVLLPGRFYTYLKFAFRCKCDVTLPWWQHFLIIATFAAGFQKSANLAIFRKHTKSRNFWTSVRLLSA